MRFLRISKESCLSCYTIRYAKDILKIFFPSSHDQISYEYLTVYQGLKENFPEFYSQYSRDLPDLSTVTYEVDYWESLWKEKLPGFLPSTIADTLKQTNPVAFPNIFTLLAILTVSPVTTCACEHSASSVRLIKPYQHSTMTQNRRNGLASLYTQGLFIWRRVSRLAEFPG